MEIEKYKKTVHKIVDETNDLKLMKQIYDIVALLYLRYRKSDN